MRLTKGEKTFQVFNNIFLIVLSFTMLFPFMHILARSLSSEVYVLSKEVILWPKGLQFGAYNYIFESQQFSRSLFNSLFITVVGSALSILMTVISAYPLSRKYFPAKGPIMLLYVITMFFSGGVIPMYLTMKNLNLLNKIWVLILPGAISPFNLILMKNFFMSIPDSIEESAKIDGCRQIRILFQIFVPLSMPAIATVLLFYSVGFWNDFFHALMYITSRKLIPLQVYLREIVIDEGSASLVDIESLMHTAPESVRAATIIAATLPILLVYPFLQKYFVKGVMVGAVKG